MFGPVNGPTGNVALIERITGLQPKTAYRWVFCASPNNGGTYACAGPKGEFGSTTADPPPDYGTFTTAGWSIVPSANATAPEGALSAVSCPASTRCTAVGSSTDSAGVGVTLAETWDGTAWTVQPTPNPTGNRAAFLSGVSCTSATACTAVGYNQLNNGSAAYGTLAERWNGTTWTIQPTPNPGGATQNNVLNAVSCTSSTACTAVGDYTDSTGTGVTLAERWDGTTWTVQPTPNPSGALASFLNGVSCTSATACTAVGSYITSARTLVMLAERWDGTAWTIQATPNPAGAQNSSLSGISCTSATACTAVGNYTDSTGSQLTLAERWDGAAWTVQPTPNPTGAQNSVLNGVSCTSATACTAVGNYTNSTGSQLTLAERWDGTAWTIHPTPNPTGAQPSLSGVSCTSATACTAVGNYTDSAGNLLTLAERWDGTTWTIQLTPNPTGTRSSTLSGVSCTSGTACTAVGGYFNSTGHQVMLAERWHGTAWTVQPTANPTGAQSSILNGVSCTSATACTAVGNYTNSTGGLTLAESWDGTAWTIQATPNPTGTSPSLSGVSCTSATACTAVGSYTNSTGSQVTLAERWDGTAWTIEPTPNPTAQSSTLSGVSCTSATACTAVGSYTIGTGHNVFQATLAERWDGTAWTIQPTPNPNSPQSTLSGVSCTSATDCTAVGRGNGALAERWDGTTWTIQPTPGPSSSSDGLSSVSCTSATACSAVGVSFQPGIQATLAERWDGTAWTIEPTPNPTGAQPSLSGVSCTSATACAAVGTYLLNGTDTFATLAERYSG